MSTNANASLYTETHTSSSVAYQELKKLLLTGEVPIGIRLREERLAERLNMSRTPVREALLRLHAEHFLDRHPEGGFRATNPSAQTMRELYEVRRALEIFALRRVHPSYAHDRAALQELRDEWVALEDDENEVDVEFVHLDEDFHRRLAEASGNIQLSEELRRINERIRPVRSHDFIMSGRIDITIEQHLEILDAVIDRKIPRATTLLEHHINESQKVVEVAVAQVLERMLNVGERDNAW